MKHPCFEPVRGSHRWLLVVSAAFLVTFGPVISVHADESGEDLYRQGRYAEAEKQFLQQDMDHPLDARFRYNRGCAAYGNEDYQAASAAFQSVLARSEDPEMRRRSLYNFGNAAFNSGQFDKAVAAYKSALALDPNDSDAGYNLELALRSIREAQKQQEQQQDSGKQDDSEQQGSQDSSEASKTKDRQQEDKGEKTEQKPDQQEVEDRSEKENKLSQKAETAKNNKPSPQEETNGTNGAGSERSPEKQEEQTAAAPMDAKMAEALLDNVEENRKPYYLFQARGAATRSGKDW